MHSTTAALKQSNQKQFDVSEYSFSDVPRHNNLLLCTSSLAHGMAMTHAADNHDAQPARVAARLS
jgi:hypothetical protein